MDKTEEGLANLIMYSINVQCALNREKRVSKMPNYRNREREKPKSGSSGALRSYL